MNPFHPKPKPLKLAQKLHDESGIFNAPPVLYQPHLFPVHVCLWMSPSRSRWISAQFGRS